MSLITNSLLIKEIIDSKKLVVFDFDGVIVDSVNVKADAFYALYESYGEDVAQKVRQHHISNGGMSRFDKIKLYHEQFLGKQLDSDEFNFLCQEFSNLVTNKVISSPSIAGVISFLKYCQNNNKVCIINSATPLEELIYIVEMRGLSHYFSGIYGSPTSKVENLNNILEDVNVSLDESVFFGDAATDFESAKSVNMDFVGVGEQISQVFNSYYGNWLMLKDFNNIASLTS